MRISITRTRLKTDRGFTLLELLLCLVIIGALLTLGAASFQPHMTELEQVVPQISAALSRARVGAMLSRHRIMLEFAADQINQIGPDGTRRLLGKLPPDILTYLNGKSLMSSSPTLLSFGPLGYAGENIIHLQGQLESWSIYLPPLGAPIARKGLLSLEEMRKEKP